MFLLRSGRLFRLGQRATPLRTVRQAPVLTVMIRHRTLLSNCNKFTPHTTVDGVARIITRTIHTIGKISNCTTTKFTFVRYGAKIFVYIIVTFKYCNRRCRTPSIVSRIDGKRNETARHGCIVTINGHV